MRKTLTSLLIAAACLPGPGRAQTTVLVELFTSQGCSACPDADAMLSTLAGVSGVLPISLHVDYWDYLGWEDDLARPQWSARQEAYAAANGTRSVYTPQMVVAGRHLFVGSDADALHEALATEMARESALSMSADETEIRLRAAKDLGEVALDLVLFTPAQSVTIRSGENAGRNIRYVNVARHWERLGAWDAKTGAEASWPLPEVPEGLIGAVIVQQPGLGMVQGVLALD